MENLINTNADEQKKAELIKASLLLLSNSLEDYAADVKTSQTLWGLGVSTDLTNDLETAFTDPFGSISKMVGKIDDSVTSLIERMLKAFFTYKKELVEAVYKSVTSNNDLHYSIVLKNDTSENRMSIFEFFEVYDMHDISKNYPVYFQFTPSNLIEKICNKEEIILA